MPTVMLGELSLTQEEIEERLARAPWRRLAVLGDSLVEGLGESTPGFPDTPWADAVAQAFARLHPGFEYLNLGRRYLTVREVRETQLERALRFRPDLASILAGGNDALANPFDAGAVEREFDAMVSALVEQGATVFLWSLMDITLTGLYPPEAREFLLPRLSEIREAVQAVAARHDAVFFDYFESPLFTDPAIFSSDLMHVNMRGHARFAEATLSGLAAHLGAVQAA